MAKPPMRPGVLSRLWTNFSNSLKRGRQIDDKSNIVGEDMFGNRYYEIPAEPSRGRRRPRRWYTNEETKHHDVRDATHTGGFDAEIPSEWESWLRHRRDAPPTNDMILQSYALADMKKRNAADLERKRIAELKAAGQYVGPDKPLDHEKTFFPKYAEYEIIPGHEKHDEKDKWADFKNPYHTEEEDKVTTKSKDKT